MQDRYLKGWDDLARLVDDHKREKWIYRGVSRRDHKLVPKVGRDGSRKDNGTGQCLPYSEDQEKLLLDEFIRQARPLVALRPDWKIEWMALAQHHRLKTRLLDWSESALVAAMFATEEGVTTETDPGSGKTENIPPAIYGIQGLAEQEAPFNPFDLHEVVVYRPAHISPRIAPQQAIFTVHPQPDQAFDDPRLVRWTLDISGTIEVKLALDAAGISRASLFPGVDGLADALNWRHKWGTLR
jgi:hypothetical protein